MDGELLSEPSESDTSSDGGVLVTSPSFTQTFEELCPRYLYYGMTAEQYWDGDCELVRFYRKKHSLHIHEQNELAWLQARYIYDAISRLAPILRSFGKKGTRAEPYLDAPYPLDEWDKQKAKEKQEKVQMDNAKRHMDMFMTQFNMKFKGKKDG